MTGELKTRKRDKMLVLPMIAYTSGFLHVGHGRSYVISDVINRWFRLRGFRSKCYFGYDSHGLPTEVKAREQGMNPVLWTSKCITEMEKMLSGLDLSWETSRINTSDFSYYKLQQEIFVLLYENDKIYRKESFVFWDPLMSTTLANEQVVEGRADRSGALVEERSLEQWFFRLESYAQELSENLKDLKGWPSRTKNLQRNWIGWEREMFFKVEGSEIETISWNKGLRWASKIEINCNYHELSRINLAGFILECRHSKALEKGKAKAVFDGKKILEVDEMYKAFEVSKASSLRDWCVSRQRSFGCPIPAVHCKRCGTVVSRELIVESPVNDLSYEKNLSLFKEWHRTKCPRCGGEALRETDTLDVLFDSCWYPIRYLVENFKDLPSDFLPVHTYVGGNEHASGHLIYIRAMFKALNDCGLDLPREPVLNFVSNGMVSHQIYWDDVDGYVNPKWIDFDGPEATYKDRKIKLLGNEKMSKSKNNVVSLEDVLDRHDVATFRLAILSNYPVDKDYLWDGKILFSVSKSLRRFKSYLHDFEEGDVFLENPSREEIELVKSIERCYDRYEFNKVIALAHSVTNKPADKNRRRILALALQPILPSFINDLSHGFFERIVPELPL